MAITLNSIAQGTITDWVADMLRNEGFESAVVDLGEFRALGRHPDGRPWRMGIGERGRRCRRARRSSWKTWHWRSPPAPARRSREAANFHHIFDPHSGESAHKLVRAAVIGPRAAAADGLATALCVVGEAQARRLLAAYPGTRAMLTRLDGTALTVGGPDSYLVRRPRLR
jgi:thiamine biosynthesis lipoprotein